MKLFLTIFIFICNNLLAQITPKTIGCFPPEIKESSGIIIGNNNTYWTHNDGNDSGFIYQLNSDLSILKKLKISNSIDEDIEDITQDENYFYVNDMGNNNNRTNLRIYKINKLDAYSKTEVKAEIIEFAYEDQHLFPPLKEEMNFDCEAFIALGDNLYLFSKNRGKSTYSYIYALPKKAGIHIAKKIDSIQTGMWVTSAAINPDKTKFALMTNGLVYIYSDLVWNQFSKSTMNRFTVSNTQKEGISFQNDSTVLITDEKNDSTDGCLYQVNLNHALKDKNKFTYFNIDPIVEKHKFYYFNYELKTMELELSFYNDKQEQIQLEKLNSKIGRRGKLDFFFPKGNYSVKIKYKDMEEVYFFKVVE
jgi:hypothetical protein